MASRQKDPHINSEHPLDNEKTMSRLQECWLQFISKRTILKEDLRPSIVNSWERCLRLNVNPQTHDPPFLDSGQMKPRLEDLGECIEALDLVIADAQELIEVSRCVIALIDSEGYVLTIHGHQSLKELLLELNFQVGANWNEQFAGTTAVGIALATGQPSHVFHAEHYCQKLHKFTCTAVPIRDPFSQKLLGLLNLVAYLPDHQPQAMGMAQLMARCIELEIYKKENKKNDIFRDRSLELTLDHLERGVIVLDDKDHIRRTNLKALDYFRMESEALINRTFQDLSALAEWRDLEKPFRFSGDDGTLLRLRREPLVHRQRLIGSLILIDPESDTSKKPVRSKMAMTHKPVGKSTAFWKALQVAENAARFDSCVLITGATGTGKEILARYIHRKGARRDKSFVAINCGSIPKELMGSELFGHEEGAFTGARKKGQAGKFELANGGTLLLDEISEMPMESQTYLLRVIEDMTLTRLGGTKQVPIDVRIIATTNKDLDKMAKEGLFRADLFYRLNVLSVDLPSLKERKEDIPLLADHFREVLSKALSKTVTDISPSALEALIAYDWPGNIRELRNALERAMVICPGETIAWKDLPEQIRIGGPIPDHLTEKERERYLHFLRSYRESGGNITRVAKMLNVSRPTVYAWRKKLGLN